MMGSDSSDAAIFNAHSADRSRAVLDIIRSQPNRVPQGTSFRRDGGMVARIRSARGFAGPEACLTMDRDPEVTKFIPGPWSDPVRHEAFLRERIETSFGEGLGYWCLFAKERPDRFVGWILLIPYDGVGPDIEIGWRLDRSAWGKGFAAEAARPIAEHAFRTIGLDRIVADIHPGNLSSLRVAEKIGMKHVGDAKHGADLCKCYVMTKADLVGLEA